MATLTIKEVLRGTTPGKMQTVGMMQIIPLLSDIEFKDFVSPGQAGTFQNHNYGSMTWKNDSDKTMIVPAHTAYLTKQAAQDHALMGAGLLQKNENKTYDTAACVQETQGGYVREGQHGFLILPFSLRESALDKRKQVGYNKLWDDIKALNTRVGVRTGPGHLEYFFKHFDKELDEFVAEFEIIPKQIGAIVLINGHIVGVERSPNHKYWETVWAPIIRGCYGSLAVEYEATKMVSEDDVQKIRIPLNLKDIKSIDDLKDALHEADKLQEESVKEIIRKFIEDPFTVENDETVDGKDRVNLTHEQFTGQAIKDGESIVYASLITTNKWFKNRAWKEANEFSI